MLTDKKDVVVEPVQEYNTELCCLEDYIKKQIDSEFTNELLYLNMATWCMNNGYHETAKFFNGQSLEERAHGIQFINFMAKRGMTVHAPSSISIDANFSSIKDIMEKGLEAEVKTTSMISKMHAEALKTSDVILALTTEFLEEQTEEEQLYRSLINLVDMCGESKVDFEMEIHTLINGKYKVGTL
jgi:ferritin